MADPYTCAIAMCYHPEAFGILFLLAFAYHALQEQTWRAWLALLLALTVKEDMWVYGVVVALLVARRGRWKRTLAFAVVAVGYYVVVVQMIGGWLYPTANYFNAYYTRSKVALKASCRLPRACSGGGVRTSPSFSPGQGCSFKCRSCVLASSAGGATCWRAR